MHYPKQLLPTLVVSGGQLVSEVAVLQHVSPHLTRPAAQVPGTAAGWGGSSPSGSGEGEVDTTDPGDPGYWIAGNWGNWALKEEKSKLPKLKFWGFGRGCTVVTSTRSTSSTDGTIWNITHRNAVNCTIKGPCHGTPKKQKQTTPRIWPIIFRKGPNSLTLTHKKIPPGGAWPKFPPTTTYGPTHDMTKAVCQCTHAKPYWTKCIDLMCIYVWDEAWKRLTYNTYFIFFYKFSLNFLNGRIDETTTCSKQSSYLPIGIFLVIGRI